MPSGHLAAVGVTAATIEECRHCAAGPRDRALPPCAPPPLPVTYRYVPPPGLRVVLALLGAGCAVIACFPSWLAPTIAPGLGRVVGALAAALYLVAWGILCLRRSVTYVRLDTGGVALKGLVGPEVNVPWRQVDRLEVRREFPSVGGAESRAVLHTVSGRSHDLEALTGRSREPARTIISLAGLWHCRQTRWSTIYRRP